jgi:hypothetical protein
MSRTPLWAVAVGSILVLGCRPLVNEKEQWAKIQIKHLMVCCEQYFLANGDWPPSLDVLVAPQPAGGKPLILTEDLIDSWGQPYQYDPTRPRNGGMRPDIWAQSPRGRVIGNWPSGR